MGLMDELKKLTQPYEDDDDFFDEADRPVQGYAVRPKPAAAAAEEDFEKKFASPNSTAAAAASAEPDADSDEDDEEMSGGLFGNLGKRVKKQSGPIRERTVNFEGKESQVILFNPKSFDEAGELVGHLARKRSLVMTLEGLPTDTARRLLDFISGITFAMKGKITPVSAKTYFISPENVDLLGSENNGN